MPGSAPDRLVLDTNTLVTAALNGKFEVITALQATHGISIFTCDKQLKEFEKTLNRVAKKLASEPEVYISLFKEFSTLVIIDERFDRSPDPDDNYLFDLAYTVKSFYLVTQEKALLNMKQVNKIKIISFRELKELIAE